MLVLNGIHQISVYIMGTVSICGIGRITVSEQIVEFMNVDWPQYRSIPFTDRLRAMRRISVLSCVATIVVIVTVAPRLWNLIDDDDSDNTPPAGVVTLLVHGMTWNNNSGIAIWGRQIGDGHVPNSDGMIGFLEKRGAVFGGVIRATGGAFSIKDALDTTGTDASPAYADLFCLEFSGSAKTDGISYKVLELSRCLQELRKLTGCRQIDIVAHSAGGLVTRAYLQEAVPEVTYAGDVRRLVTIGTPHLGAAIAQGLGDLIGTRATSLTPDSELIGRMNTLPLPTDVNYASLVVKGIGVDLPDTLNVFNKFGIGTGTECDHLIDHEVLRHLPADYHKGGDQVCHVKTQNLRLCRCSQQFEEATGRAVHAVLIRVPDPTPGDSSPFEQRVHVVAAWDAIVLSWVGDLLSAPESFWKGDSCGLTKELKQLIIQQCVFSAIEQQTMKRHSLSQVLSIDNVRYSPTQASDQWQEAYSFHGTATSRVLLLGNTSETYVNGMLTVNFDNFGRICESESHEI